VRVVKTSPGNAGDEPGLDQDHRHRSREHRRAIDDIAGTISALGRKAGVPTPVNDVLYELAKVRRPTQERQEES